MRPDGTTRFQPPDYGEAGDLYQAASRQVRPQLRWAYQGQAAAAYIALYRLSADAEALTKAKKEGQRPNHRVEALAPKGVQGRRSFCRTWPRYGL